MRKLFILFAALFAFAACTQNEVEEFSANRADVPETLTVGFEGGDTRIELNEVLKTVWTEGDEVSVFYQSYENTRWAFQGATGDRSGELILVSGEVGAQTMNNSIIVYPYSDSYYLNTESCDIQAMLPAVQGYKVSSYGEGGNIMVAQSEFTQFSLKSVVGWLRVELTGEGQMVESITLRGNAGEQVAGLIYVDTATAEATLASEMGEASDEEQVGGVGGGLEFDDTVFTDVTLDCGDGVELGAEATAFYIALLPQTFEKGMTIEINYANGNSQPLVCENSITISRNHISPINIEASEEAEVLANQLWYTATALVEPFNTSAFNVSIVSNEWDETTGEGVITFDGELTTIGDMAFYYCSSLTSVVIPDSVTTIGDRAFMYCYSLTSVTIPDSVTTIGGGAFASCYYLAEFNGKFAADGGRCLIIDGVLNAFALGCGVTEYTIPDSVTTIGANAFESCSSLTSVTIPDSVTTIGDRAFSSCDSLAEFKGKFASEDGCCLIVDGVLKAFALGCGVTEYTIPDSVTTIGEMAFAMCDSLTSVTIDGGVTTIGNWAFGNCSSLTSVTIGDGVMTIGYGVFDSCSNLESVTIGNSVATIGDFAFCYCESLISITIPDSVTTIGEGAFERCRSLTSVTIGNSVTTIGNRAFFLCDSLTSITIPDSVTTIGMSVFVNCGSLTSVYCKAATPPTLGDSAIFDYNASGRKIYVPAESVDAYKAAENWSGYAADIVGYDFE